MSNIEGQMSVRDRTQLEKLMRFRAKVAKGAVRDRELAMVAELERQLSAVFPFDDEHWARVTAAAEVAVRSADEQVAEACTRMGIPSELRPRLQLSWYGRGESAVASRRAELRRLGMARIRSLSDSACLEIDRRTVELMTNLIVGGLQSADAHAFLDAMPSVEQLMPHLDVHALHTTAGSSMEALEDPDDFE